MTAIAIDLINLLDLVDPKKCFALIRSLRWGERVICPKCGSHYVIKAFFDDTQPERQRYQCKKCQARFDDLTDTIFPRRHQPLAVFSLSPTESIKSLYLNRRRIKRAS